MKTFSSFMNFLIFKIKNLLFRCAIRKLMDKKPKKVTIYLLLSEHVNLQPYLDNYSYLNMLTSSLILMNYSYLNMLTSSLILMNYSYLNMLTSSLILWTTPTWICSPPAFYRWTTPTWTCSPPVLSAAGSVAEGIINWGHWTAFMISVLSSPIRVNICEFVFNYILHRRVAHFTPFYSGCSCSWISLF